LPGLPPKGDVSDWLDTGGTRSELERLAAEAPDFRPAKSNDASACHQKPQSDADVIIDGRAPYAPAELFLDRNFSIEEKRTLHHHRGAFYHWNGIAYPGISEGEELRARLYEFLDQCVTIDKKGKARPIKPNAAMVSNVLDGLRATENLNASISAPAWLDHAPDLAAQDMIACENGLLHLPTLTLLPHTPAFFTYNALDFSFDANALEPQQWLGFLDQL
jgi:putative DNA primase/helicase